MSCPLRIGFFLRHQSLCITSITGKVSTNLGLIVLETSVMHGFTVSLVPNVQARTILFSMCSSARTIEATLHTCHTMGYGALDLSPTPWFSAVLTQCPICTESVDIPNGDLASLPLALVRSEPTVDEAILGTFC